MSHWCASHDVSMELHVVTYGILLWLAGWLTAEWLYMLRLPFTNRCRCTNRSALQTDAMIHTHSLQLRCVWPRMWSLSPFFIHCTKASRVGAFLNNSRRASYLSAIIKFAEGRINPHVRLDWIEQGLMSQSTHFRSFRRRWADCGISQDCSRSQSAPGETIIFGPTWNILLYNFTQIIKQ